VTHTIKLFLHVTAGSGQQTELSIESPILIASPHCLHVDIVHVEFHMSLQCQQNLLHVFYISAMSPQCGQNILYVACIGT